MKGFKKVLVITGVLVSIHTTSYAAIPVIDNSNIMQQIKTYTETLNVVKNTAEQIRNQVQELTSLPTQLLNEYKQHFTDSMNAVTRIMKGDFSNAKDIDKYVHSCFPSLKDSNTYKMTLEGLKQSNDTILANLSQNNMKDIKAYSMLTNELDKSKKSLEKLLEQNKNAKGAKQTAQIQNQIAAEKANIQSIQTGMQAIEAKNKAMKEQADIIREQNKIKQGEASSKATDTSIKKITSYKAPSDIYQSPWEKYSSHKGWW